MFLVLKDQITTKLFDTSHGTFVITECYYREINNVYSVIFIMFKNETLYVFDYKFLPKT